MTNSNYSTIRNNFKINDNIESLLLYDDSENKKIDISICIPTFNRVQLLQEAIESCYNQEKNNLSVEIIVVDNNPLGTNGNEELIKQKKYKNLKYYRNNKNIGIFGNWNRCFELSSGKWVSLLHDDDLLANDCFHKWEKILSKIKDNKVGYIKTSIKTFNDEKDLDNIKIKEKIKNKFSSNFYNINHFDYAVTGTPGLYGMPTCGTLLEKEAVISVGGYNNDYYPSDDAYMPVRLYDNGYATINVIGYYGYYRIGVNESQKLDTHIGWINEFVSFQSFIKKYNNFFNNYITFFENEQLNLFVNEYISKFSTSSDFSIINDKIKEMNRFKISKIKITILKSIRKVTYKSHIIRAIFTRRISI